VQGSFAGIAGIGLPLFQHLIPRPGLSTDLYRNTRRIGAIVSGPIIAVGALTALGQRGVFLTSAVVTLLGLLIIAAARWVTARRTADAPQHRGIPAQCTSHRSGRCDRF
jgi:SET family sugar efflux transporter-like MFS transporter